MQDHTPSTRAYATCAGITLAVFVRALPYPLQRSWDDGRFITDNPLVMQPSWQGLLDILARPQLEAYHPLHLLSYWIDAPWTGAAALVLHAVNLGLWLVAACVLLRVMTRLGLPVPLALVATLACVVHPVQVEVVSWATGRKDVLAMLFSCLCLDAHLRSQRAFDRASWWARAYYALGLLSKTTVLPMPLVLAAVDVLLRKRSLRAAARAQLPSGALGAVLAGLVLVIWDEHAMIRPEGERTGNVATRVVASLGHQLSTLLWPSELAPMYGTDALANPPALAYFGVLALCLTVLISIRLARKGEARAGLVAFGAITFILWCLPVGNIVPMVFPFQDRYASLPAFGLAIALGAGLHALPARRAHFIGMLCVLALGLRCAQYQGVWRDELALWGHAAHTQPNAYYAWLKLGEVRRERGDLHGAIDAYRRLLELDPARKTGYAALLLAVALRDERVRGLSPSRANAYAAESFAALDDPQALRVLSGKMLASGHLRALELPMLRALTLQPVSDSVLERAAATHFTAGRASVGLFYLRRMRVPTERPDLLAARSLAERAMATAPRVVD